MQIVSVSQALAAQQTEWVLFLYRVLDAALTSLHCACSFGAPYTHLKTAFHSCTWCAHVCAQPPRFCKTHKLADMMNVRTRLCEVCGGYMKGGGYKLDDDKRVRWCVLCKPANAISGRPSTKKKKSTDSSST
jgi:hypothetical protein